MKRCSILIVALFHFLAVSAQSLSGNVTDDNDAPIAYATVMLSVTNDSILYSGLTNEHGAFLLENIKDGECKLQISYVGYKSYSKDITINGNVILPHIKLVEGIELGEVTVVGRRKLVSYDQGKIKLSVTGSKLVNLPSSLDVLSFVPGVQVSQNSITVIGKGKPLVLINGREVRQLSEIYAIQPESIKSITVDRNPSAQYDAECNSVIQIVTKHRTEDNFAVQYIQGVAVNRNFNHSETININYSKGAFDNFISYKFKRTNNTETAYNYQQITQIENSYVNSYEAEMQSSENNNSLTVGTKVHLNSRNSIDIQYLFNHNAQNGVIDSRETINNTSTKIFNIYRTGNTYTKDHHVSTNYKFQIDSTKILQIYADYIEKNDVSDENILSGNLSDNTEESRKINSFYGFKVYSARAEYSAPIFSNYNYNIGLRYSAIRSDANALMKTNNSIIDFDNQSALAENNTAAYATVSRKMSSFYGELGLRAEYTMNKYTNNGESIFDKPREMVYLFPSLLMNYNISDKMQLNLSYVGKIKRPSFYNIDPTIHYLSSKLYEQGNPALKPTYENKISIGTVIKNNLSINLGYAYSKNLIGYAATPIQDGILMYSPVNIPNGSSIELNVSYSLSVGSLTSNFNGNLSIPSIHYPYNGTLTNINIPHLEFLAINMYSINPFIFAFCNFGFDNKHTYLNNTFLPTYRLTAGVNFVLMSGKMGLTVFGNDLLNQTSPTIISRYGSVELGQKSYSDSRMVGITLKVNFNKFRNRFKRNESNQSDLDRITK